MGIRDFLSDLNEDRKRAQRKLKDEFLGFTSSASRKFIPRELRPALPFLAAAVPFMLPTSGNVDVIASILEINREDR